MPVMFTLMSWPSWAGVCVYVRVCVCLCASVRLFVCECASNEHYLLKQEYATPLYFVCLPRYASLTPEHTFEAHSFAVNWTPLSPEHSFEVHPLQ